MVFCTQKDETSEWHFALSYCQGGAPTLAFSFLSIFKIGFA